MSDYRIVHLSEVYDWDVYDCSRPGQRLCACSQQADAERIARALRLLAVMEDEMPTTLQTLESLPLVKR